MRHPASAPHELVDIVTDQCRAGDRVRRRLATVDPPQGEHARRGGRRAVVGHIDQQVAADVARRAREIRTAPAQQRAYCVAADRLAFVAQPPAAVVGEQLGRLGGTPVVDQARIAHDQVGDLALVTLAVGCRHRCCSVGA